MNPTDILSAEHRVILRVLSCLDAIAHQALTQGKLDRDAAAAAIAFFRQFADHCHHGKEEKHLFGRLEQRGIPRAGGPVGVMLQEHDLGRAEIRGMAAALEAAAQGQPEALRVFVQHAHGYIELLRNHIHKEDNILFPMADQVFSEQDQRDLAEAFDRVEKEEMGEGVHESFHAIADQLGEHYGIPPVLGEEMGEGVHESFHAIADQRDERCGIPPVLCEEEAHQACAHRYDS